MRKRRESAERHRRTRQSIQSIMTSSSTVSVEPWLGLGSGLGLGLRLGFRSGLGLGLGLDVRAHLLQGRDDVPVPEGVVGEDGEGADQADEHGREVDRRVHVGMARRVEGRLVLLLIDR